MQKKPRRNTLDIGCGYMDLKNHIKTENYQGIDIIDYKLKTNKKLKFKKINFNNFYSNKKFDLIVCHNTINYNGAYNSKDFVKNFNKMIDMLESNGYLSFNFGQLNRKEFYKIDKHIVKNLKKKKLSVIKSYKYGFFHYKYNNLLFSVIFNIIKFFPFLDRNNINQNLKYYLFKKL